MKIERYNEQVYTDMFPDIHVQPCGIGHGYYSWDF